ncbi:MAG TPA: ankyrin repeat domain-containing protein [Phenylobacterium sp.]
MKILLIAAALAAAALGAGSAWPAFAQLEVMPADIPSLQAVEKRIAAGADPVEDAAAAAKAGEFGLLLSGVFPSEGHTLGVVCMTPYLKAPKTLARLITSDFIGPPLTPLTMTVGSYDGYATRYNRALVDRPEFPYADLCAPETKPARAPPRDIAGLAALKEAARIPARPVSTLQEAARRGTLMDVRRLIAAEPVDALDDLKMTALDWAVARNRPQIVKALLAAGANPARQQRQDAEFGITPLLLAIAFGHDDILDQLLEARGGPPPVWPETYVEAALRSDDAAMIRRIFSQNHQRPRQGFYPNLAPDLAAFAAIIEVMGPMAANDLLLEGAREGRLDLMRQALNGHADPNTHDPSSHATPLGLALQGYKPGNEAAIELLIASKADVNMPAMRGRFGVTPVWMALNRYRILRDLKRPSPAQALEAVLAAQPDVQTPDVPGLPPIWSILFSPRLDPAEIDGAPSAEVLGMLVKAGLDLNAPHDGKRALDVVESRAGAGSPLAITLRKLGAVHAAERPPA